MLPIEKMHLEGPDTLATWELISILFGHGTKKENVFACAKRIVKDYGFTMPANHHPKMLKKQYSLTKNHAVRLSACIELGNRWFQPQTELMSIDTPYKVVAYVQEMKVWRKEVFRGLYMNSRYQLIWDEMISMGDLLSSNVHPREIFAPAIRIGAAAIIILHNHPSGSPEPSDEDITTTNTLTQAANIMHIPIVDHIIIAKRGWYSFQEHGLM